MAYTCDPNTMLTEVFRASRDLPAISATITLPVMTSSFEHLVRVGRVELMVDATYTADTANYYAFTLQVGATVSHRGRRKPARKVR